MKLIFGLGNIGSHFNGSRHNSGFMALDNIAAAMDTSWQQKDKFRALIAETSIQGQKTILAKPTTYYNLAGESARAIKDFYKLDNTDILVVHDELDLPFGTVRARIGGSSAGNNGIKSIVSHVGDNVPRLRIGVANDLLPTFDAADFVLNRFTAEEAAALPTIFAAVRDMAYQFIANQKLEPTSVRVLE